jgi:hypothetical protein
MKLRDEDLWVLLLCSLRYAMGRASYVTGEVADMIRRYKSHLTAPQRAQIAGEIRTAVRDAHNGGGFLGMKMDEDGWVRLAEEMEGEKP